jgi:hypothetical protein
MQDVEAVVLVTTVEIAPNYSKAIKLRRGDDPHDAAAAFCRAFCLSEEVQAPLARHLETNLKRAMVHRLPLRLAFGPSSAQQHNSESVKSPRQ